MDLLERFPEVRYNEVLLYQSVPEAVYDMFVQDGWQQKGNE